MTNKEVSEIKYEKGKSIGKELITTGLISLVTLGGLAFSNNYLQETELIKKYDQIVEQISDYHSSIVFDGFRP